MRNKKGKVRFQVLKANNIKMAVFSDVALSVPVKVYRRLRGSYCLHGGRKHL
jgi:hypothetical protein